MDPAPYINSCENCGRDFETARALAAFCSNACRQAAYRQRTRIATNAEVGRAMDDLNRDLAAAGRPERVDVMGYRVVDADTGLTQGGYSTWQPGRRWAPATPELPEEPDRPGFTLDDVRKRLGL